MQKEAHVLTEKDREELAKRTIDERNAAQDAARQRKVRAEEMEKSRNQHHKLSDVEQEAREKNKYLLAKAQLQLEEEEDDIKHLNELMLNAKSVAIRDMQVEEKVRRSHSIDNVWM